MVTQTKRYATPKQFSLLKKFKLQGTLSQKELTTDLWLTASQASELGYNRGESDFLLRTTKPEPGALYGKIPTPESPYLPIEKAIQQGRIGKEQIKPLAEPPIPTPAPPPIIPQAPPITPQAPGVLPQEPISLTGDYGLLYKEYLRTGGTLDAISWGAAGLPLRPGEELEVTDEGLQRFLNQLVRGGQISDVENILRGFDVSEDEIDQIVGIETRENELQQLVTAVFPDLDMEGFIDFFETEPDSLLQELRQIGRTKKTQDLLRLMGFEFWEMEEVFHPGVVQSKWKAVWNKLWVGSVEFGHNTLQGALNVLPRNLFPDITEGQSKVTGMSDKQARQQGLAFTAEEAATATQQNRQTRDIFRAIAAREQTDYEGWVAKHPELKPRPEWEGEILTLLKDDPALILDPAFIAYVAADSAAFMASFWGATAVVGGITKNPVAGMAAGVLVTTPAQVQDLHQDLLRSGATEQQAADLAVPLGTLISSVEIMGGLAVLRAVGALPGMRPFYQTFRRNLQREVGRSILRTMAKRGVLTFSEIELAEMFEEVLQGAIQNATVKTFDESREVLGGIAETLLRTFITTFPMGIIGGGANVRVTHNQMTNAQRQKVADMAEQLRDAGMPEEQAEMVSFTQFAETPEGQGVVDRVMEAVPEQVAPEAVTRGEPVPEIKPPAVAPEVTPAPEVTEVELLRSPPRDVPYQEVRVNLPKQQVLAEFEADLAQLRARLPSENAINASFTQQEIKVVQDNIKRVRASTGDTVAVRRYRPEPAIPEAEPVVPAAPAVEAPKIKETTPTGEKIDSTYSEAPEPTEGATARVFARIQTEPAESNFIEKVKQGWHKFNIKMVDDLDPIKRIVDQLKKGDVQLSIDENPYLLARLLRGVTSKATTFLEYGTFGKNFYKVDKQGRASPNYTGEPLEAILNEVKDPVKWRDFSTYLTARRAVELSARDIETGIELTDARASISELEARYPQFKDLAQRVYKYQDSLLVYAQEMGLLSKEMLEKLRKYGNYVPFYRVFNELQAKGLFGKKMANVANPIKRIKGSEREIINPLESIVKNTYVLVNAADRNQVGIAIANLVDKNPELADVFERVKTPIARVARVSAKELGVEIEGLTEAEEEQMVDIFRPSFFVRGDEVTVLINGKKSYYRVDEDLRDSLLRLDRESLGLLGKWLGAPARWLRAGATLSPDFMFRNPARDQLTAFAYSNYGFMPGIDFIKGIASILRKDADYQLFRMSGAEHSMLVSMDRSYLAKTFKQIVEGKGFTEYVKHPMELFRIISELGEKGTRLGEFKKGIQSGTVPLEAGYSARSVTLDFAQAGTTAQAINTFIAFFNANIRGWGRMASSFKEHPIRTSAKVFLGITLPSILLWAVNHDDERWKEIPQWQKDLFWIVFVGDNIYRIPKPFELGIIFGSVPERFLDWLVERDPDLLKDLAQTLMEAGSPGFIPTAGLPILEWITNYSFFRGRAIVPESRKDLPPELQYTRWTSEVSKRLGELLKQPPAKLDNLLFAWTGGLGRYATDILDGILKGTGISPDVPEPSPTLADLPVIKAFVVRSPFGSSSEAVNDFYNLLEKYEGGEKYLKEMLIAGELEKFDKFKAAHPELFFFADFESERYQKAIEKGETPKDVFYSSSARYLRRVARDLSEIRKKEDLIYKDPDMSSEKKRELIDELEILKTDIARRAVDLLQQKEPVILKEMVNEVVSKLGETIEEATPLSLEKADIFDVPDAYRELDSILEGATAEDLQGLEGINPLAFAYLRKEELEKTLEPILNKQIKDIDFNLKEGVTFEDYYKQWQLGLIQDSPLGKISRRQVELLRKYEASDDKKAFLKSLSDEERDLLSENPQKEWLKSRPTENAEWALAGKAKLLTKEAYDEFIRLIKELDIPDSAIPEMTLPPEGSIDNYFEYQEMENKNSWEAQLMLAQDDDLLQFLGRQPIDTPIASLELKVKNRKHDDAYEALETDEERAQYKLDNPEWIDDTRRIKAIEKGTDEAPTADENVNLYVDRGKLIDQEGIGSGSAEIMLQRVDNPDFDAWLTDEEIWGDEALKPIDESRIPIWRIDVQMAGLDEDSPEYALLSRQRDAHSGGFADIDNGIETYVKWYDTPKAGFEDDWFLMENNAFYKKMVADGLIKERDFSNVPDIKWRDTWETIPPRKQEAIIKGVPELMLDTYVDYYTIIGEGKPADQDLWFKDDWFLMEHKDFYRNVYLNPAYNNGIQRQRKDFRNVPTREIFELYLEYLRYPLGNARKQFRADHRDLDGWGVGYFGWTPIEPDWEASAPSRTPQEEAWDYLERVRKGVERLGRR